MFIGSACGGGARERGASAIEYIALIVVAALVMGGLYAAGIPSKVPSATRSALCAIVDAPGCRIAPQARSGGAQPAGWHPDGQQPGGQQPGDDRPAPQQKKDDGCHGFGGCSWHITKSFFGGAGSALKDTGSGIKTLFTTRPDHTVVGLTKYLWSKSGGSYVDAFTSCTSGDWSKCQESAQCVALNFAAAGCLLYDTTFDEQTRDDFAHGRISHGVGRLGVNIGLDFLPTKVPGLNKIGRIAKGAEQGGKVAEVVDALANARKARGKAELFRPADAQALIGKYRSLSDAEKTAFLDRLTPSEFLELYSRGGDIGADMLARLSPKKAAELYKKTDIPNFRSDILAGVSPKAVAKIKPNPKPHRFVGWKKIKTRLFDGRPKMTDVGQGGYGTCWCMASMEELAKRTPDLVKNMFKKNPNGTYTITFGDKTRVTVTPDVPRDAATTARAAWPALLEKAFAQRAGSYKAVEGGNPLDAMEMMTGKKGVTYEGAGKPSVSDIGRGINDGRGYVVGFEEKKLLSGIPKLKERGIYADHAYSVVGVDEYAGTVTLSNPWGPHVENVRLTATELEDAGVTLYEVPTR